MKYVRYDLPGLFYESWDTWLLHSSCHCRCSRCSLLNRLILTNIDPWKFIIFIETVYLPFWNGFLTLLHFPCLFFHWIDSINWIMSWSALCCSCSWTPRPHLNLLFPLLNLIRLSQTSKKLFTTWTIWALSSIPSISNMLATLPLKVWTAILTLWHSCPWTSRCSLVSLWHALNSPSSPSASRIL